jgi:glutathione S-transferase
LLNSQQAIEERSSKEVIKAKRLLETACNLLDENLQGRTWLAGEKFSCADCAAAPVLAYLRIVYSYKRLSRLTDYVRRLEARSTVAKVQSEGRGQMIKMLSGLKYAIELVEI